jgi:muconate cycloisomerase
VAALCDRIAPRVRGDDPRQCGGNALRCALELAILDAWGRLFNESLRDAVPYFASLPSAPRRRDPLRYSAAIGLASPGKERALALAIRMLGFRHCKIKAGPDGDQERARMLRMRQWLGRRMDIRVDVNGAWPAELAARFMASLMPANVSCIEQPVAHAEVASLAEIRRETGIPVMLDESLASEVDAQAATRGGWCDLFNIRLSKCGGFLKSLRLAQFARATGIGYQLGCHPGETGILGAAGRHWAASDPDVRWLEGSFLLNTNLLRGRKWQPPGGRVREPQGPGLGIQVNLKKLAVLSRREHRIRLA